MASKSKRYCSVPQCNAYVGGGISMHYFPSDKKLCKKWQTVLKIGKNISHYMCVCSKHFTADDFYPTPPVPDNNVTIKFKRTLRKGVVPSQNLPKGTHDCQQNKQRTPKVQESKAVNQTTDATVLMDIAEEAGSRNDLPVHIDNESNVQSAESIEKTFEHKGTQTDITGTFNLYHVLDNEEKVRAFTNVNYTICSNLEKCCERVAIYNQKSVKDLKMKILLVLVKLKLNISFVCLGILFGISSTSASRYIYSTLTLLSAATKSWIYWPTKEEVVLTIPKCFKKFQQTRVVLDATEIGVDRCKCVQCRVKTYSHYKGRLTVKFLIGITLSGMISFVSKAYGGRISDKGIFNNEKIVEKLEAGDAVMVDKGVLIEKECDEHLVTLIRPPFLRKKTQFSKADAERTANIAQARVHVERAIERIKSFSILKSQISWYLLPYLNDIMTVIAAIVNVSRPILAEDKFDQCEIDDYDTSFCNLGESTESSLEDIESYFNTKLEARLVNAT